MNESNDEVSVNFETYRSANQNGPQLHNNRNFNASNNMFS
jgi:hypothetical protein